MRHTKERKRRIEKSTFSSFYPFFSQIVLDAKRHFLIDLSLFKFLLLIGHSLAISLRWKKNKIRINWHHIALQYATESSAVLLWCVGQKKPIWGRQNVRKLPCRQFAKWAHPFCLTDFYELVCCFKVALEKNKRLTTPIWTRDADSAIFETKAPNQDGYCCYHKVSRSFMFVLNRAPLFSYRTKLQSSSQTAER